MCRSRPARGARLLGLRFGRVLEVEAHAQGGGPILRGVAVLGPLARRPGGDDARLALRRLDGRRRRARARRRSARTRSTTSSARRPTRSSDCGSRPTSSRSRRVVSPELADARRREGRLARPGAGRDAPLRVVGTARHFPSVVGPFVVVDRDELAVALHALLPGAGTAERDLARRAVAAAGRCERALARPPFDVLDVGRAPRCGATLEDDPLTRGTILLLLAATAIALLLGVLAVFFLAETDVRDGRRRAARPRDPGRRAARAAAPPAPAAAARRAAGRASAACSPGSRSAASSSTLRRADATADVPEPPLVLHADWALLLLALAAFLVAAALSRVVALALGLPRRLRRGGAPMTAAIEAREVFHVYESPEGNTAALQGLTLSIDEGQITASSARAARASRRCCGSSPGSSSPRPGRCACSAATSAG